MKTYHIHIQGIVQGVGFRPAVYKFCAIKQVNGWVNNTSDGVHIHVNLPNNSEHFVEELLAAMPKLAVITNTVVKEITYVDYKAFNIVRTEDDSEGNTLLITPDFGMCEDCANELYEKTNKRYQYPFITCTNCGPRFSIIASLPYDRDTTTMDGFKMCTSCRKEYDDPLDRRYYSQTNSCPDCKIKLELYERGVCLNDDFSDLDYIVSQWKNGKIVAIKGVGGYLLTCDASNEETIKRLRTLKDRPKKPFALMYASLLDLEKDTIITDGEKDALISVPSPIVLLRTKKNITLPIHEITKGLDSLGVMLPYTPLYKLLLDKYKKPIIATSANVSSNTIIYEDNITELTLISDTILSNNREIVVAQDDSVVRFNLLTDERIILRRSRGLAPSYINPVLSFPKDKSIIALGAMLKSTFTLLDNKNVHISQYLGNTTSFEAQENYKKVLKHYENLFSPKITTVVGDLHPNYFTTAYGKKLAARKNVNFVQVQHHKAHFYAVLGEHNLLKTKDSYLGVIWDGTGYGEDANVWGGEFFSYKQGKVKRVHHLDEYPFILGDKLPREPRIAALVMSSGLDDLSFLKDKFTTVEWQVYTKLITDATLKSTSVGRLFDAVASILIAKDIQSFEGEAAMLLEGLATSYLKNNNISLNISYLDESSPKKITQFIIKNILKDMASGIEKSYISARFHVTLVDYIVRVANEQNENKIAFSGGVFQNKCLVAIAKKMMSPKFDLYFHKDLSPNDENISFGQMMYVLYNKN